MVGDFRPTLVVEPGIQRQPIVHRPGCAGRVECRLRGRCQTEGLQVLRATIEGQPQGLRPRLQGHVLAVGCLEGIPAAGIVDADGHDFVDAGAVIERGCDRTGTTRLRTQRGQEREIVDAGLIDLERVFDPLPVLDPADGVAIAANVHSALAEAGAQLGFAGVLVGQIGRALVEQRRIQRQAIVIHDPRRCRIVEWGACRRLDTFDQEHVVVVVVVDAGVIHDHEVGIGDGVSGGVVSLEDTHGMAALDTRVLGRGRTAAGRIQRRIGGEIGDRDAEDVVAGPAVGYPPTSEGRRCIVAVGDLRQERLAIEAVVIAQRCARRLVARGMQRQQRATVPVQGRQLGDCGRLDAVGDLPVARQHFLVVGRSVEIEILQHGAATTVQRRQAIDVIAEAEHLPDLVEVGLPAPFVPRLPEAGQLDLRHRLIGIVGDDRHGAFEDATGCVTGRRCIGVPVEQYANLDGFAGRQPQVIEGIRVRQHERAAQRHAADPQITRAVIGDDDRPAILVLARHRGRAGRIVVFEIIESDAVAEVGRIGTDNADVAVGDDRDGLVRHF